MTPKSSRPTISGSLSRRTSAGTPTITAIATANFAKGGSASQYVFLAGDHHRVLLV
jgi:hypothetical protein